MDEAKLPARTVGDVCRTLLQFQGTENSAIQELHRVKHDQQETPAGAARWKLQDDRKTLQWLVDSFPVTRTLIGQYLMRFEPANDAQYTVPGKYGYADVQRMLANPIWSSTMFVPDHVWSIGENNW